MVTDLSMQCRVGWRWALRALSSCPCCHIAVVFPGAFGSPVDGWMRKMNE